MARRRSVITGATPDGLELNSGDERAQTEEGRTFGDLRREHQVRMEESRVHLRSAVRAMASEAGFGGRDRGYPGLCNPKTEGESYRDVSPGSDVNKDGGAHTTGTMATANSVKTPKYNGKVSWEAFHAQFELLARSQRWSTETKALQLALCLTEDALACLLLLDIDERDNYDALVGALQRRFGNFTGADLLRTELVNRHRQQGEPLRQLANDIESLTRRAYRNMPPAVQGELARDRFIQALSPSELRIEVQLSHPRSLQEALERASERETARAYVPAPAQQHVTRAATEEPQRPAWAAELTELVRAASLGAQQHPDRTARRCWGCGRSGHLVRSCPKTQRNQGNDPGSA